MDSSDRRISLISILVCIFLCFGSFQSRACDASNNELRKVEVKADAQVAQALASSKIACVTHGGSYDERGACYRGVSNLPQTGN